MNRARIWNVTGGGPAPAVPQLGDKQWFKITNLGGNSADLWIYAEIGGWGVTAEALVSELAALNVAEITVHLNSPGGDVFDGIAITNALRDHPANIVVKVDALAASIASVIAQAANKVIMGRNSMMMIHNASGFAMGEATDLRKMADLLDQTTENIASIYAERAGGTTKQWLKVMEAETWYSADEAVAAGLADEVAPLATEREAHQQAARFDLTVFNHAPKIEPIPAVDLKAFADSLTQTREFQPVLEDLPDDFEYPIAWDPALFRTAALAAVPPPVTWNPSLFKAAVSLVTNDMPNQEPPKTPEPEPVSVFDPSLFSRAMREAIT